MELFLGFLLGVIASLFAGFLQPTLRKGMKSLYIQLHMWVNPSSVSITDHWESTFEEPEANGKLIKTTETIDLKQSGLSIKGESDIGGPYPREFTYDAELYHDLVWGKYENKGAESGATSGRGVFLLELSKDRKTMEGFCAWLDKDTKKVELSKYLWSRK